MDDVERLLSDIQSDREIMRTKFTGLLDDTADVLEKHGFGITRAFLLEKKGRPQLRQQAEALLKILDLIERYSSIKSDRTTARLLIKCIDSLRKQRGGER